MSVRADRMLDKRVTWSRRLSPRERLFVWTLALGLMWASMAAIAGGARPLPKIVDLLRFGADTPLAKAQQLLEGGFWVNARPWAPQP